MIYIQLFWSFFQIGLLSFGGGYAALPLIQEQIVEKNGWISMTEFADVITISQMTPGPIAINAASFVGIQLGGTFGAVVATVGCITPSILIALTLAHLYYKYRKLTFMQGILQGLRPAVVAMIASAGISLAMLAFFGGNQISFDLGSIDLIAVFLFCAGFFALRKWKLNPILIMIGTGVIGGCMYLFNS